MNAFVAIFRMSWLILFNRLCFDRFYCILTPTAVRWNVVGPRQPVVVELWIWIMYREELDVLNHCTLNVAIIIIPSTQKTSENRLI